MSLNISQRDHFAIECLKTIIELSGSYDEKENTTFMLPARVAIPKAIEYADALIAALDETKPTPKYGRVTLGSAVIAPSGTNKTL